jgi:phosphopantothenoylcysteine decarboxylase/phosphopantothenate--cysteine ligase
MAELGAETFLVSGPTAEPPPHGVKLIGVETAAEMLVACQATLPVDAAVCAAAVTDWRSAEIAPQKLKKKAGAAPPMLKLAENPDILAELSRPGPRRPALVVGFALETEHLIENASAKRQAKGCDWIVANQATQDSTVFGSNNNSVALVTAAGAEFWPRASKQEVGRRLAASVADFLAGAASPRQPETAQFA